MIFKNAVIPNGSRVPLGVFSNMQAASVRLLNAMGSIKGRVINQAHCGRERADVPRHKSPW